MDTSVIGQIAALRRLSVRELQAEWESVFGRPARSSNRTHLWRRLAWELQARAHGGISTDAHTRIAELAPEVLDCTMRATRANPAAGDGDVAIRPADPRRVRDPRLPTPGTIIVKNYKGRELRLVVHEDHFELDGQSFNSLSQAARHVTGSHWNGRLFWRLTERKRK